MLRRSTGTLTLVLAAVACGGQAQKDQQGPGVDLQCRDVPSACTLFAVSLCEHIERCHAEGRGVDPDSEKIAECSARETRSCAWTYEGAEPGPLPECLSDLDELSCPMLLARYAYYGVDACINWDDPDRTLNSSMVEYLMALEGHGDPVSNDSCENRYLRQVDGSCVTKAQEEELCDEGECDAIAGLYCDDGVCRKMGRLGDDCSPSAPGSEGTCDTYFELECVAGECVHKVLSGEGEGCGLHHGDEYSYTLDCVPGFSCGHLNDLGSGRCVPVVGAGEECGSAAKCDVTSLCDRETSTCKADLVFCED